MHSQDDSDNESMLSEDDSDSESTLSDLTHNESDGSVLTQIMSQMSQTMSKR